jgi:hypothetical protein
LLVSTLSLLPGALAAKPQVMKRLGKMIEYSIIIASILALCVDRVA